MRSGGGGGGAELVVDASVVKWYVLEPDREGALRIREDYIDGRAGGSGSDALRGVERR